MISVQDLEYQLPPELIASHPADKRESSRILFLSKSSDEVSEGRFSDVLSRFKKGDLVILNQTRVMKARLLGTRDSGSPQEILLVQKLDDEGFRWKAMLKASKKMKPGRTSDFSGYIMTAHGFTKDGFREVSFDRALSFEVLEKIGEIPLPPYIVRKREDDGETRFSDEDEERYQTVFAKNYGSVAAPTASLHFSEEMLDSLKEKGVEFAEVLLHVGPGTFKPIEGEIEDYEIHREWIEVSEETASKIKAAKADGRRVIAIGTTATRAVETAAKGGEICATQGYTDLFIFPPYEFKVVNALLTNFHLPRSSLLLLVYAFYGMEKTKSAYRYAIQNEFRFYSYGDAMFIE